MFIVGHVITMMLKCIRIINLKQYNNHTNPLFVDNKLLKLKDIIEMNYVELMFNIINNKLPPDLSILICFNILIPYNTRNVSNQGLHIPSINTTTTFGNKSLRYNTLLKTNLEISNSV